MAHTFRLFHVPRADSPVSLIGVLLILLLLAASVASAQQTDGELRGRVCDPFLGSVADASVVATNLATGYTRAGTTDPRGEFAFLALPPGDYRLEVTADGFKAHTSTVSVRPLATSTALLRLEMGTREETVEVTAQAAVDVTHGGVQQVMSEEILDFPNINRYGLANANLMPAIEQETQGTEAFKEEFKPSVAGNVQNRNTFYIDGADATFPLNGFARMPGVDAFEEVVVDTAGAQVDVGANFGGTFNAIFKSGTNTWHGGAWYFFGNESLDANSWQNNRNEFERPPHNLKYWGAQGGGPIVRDTLFFYATLHREIDETVYTLTNRFAPTPAMIQGDFSVLPYTMLNPDTGQAFPGNVIPPSMLDPVAVTFWDRYGYSIPVYDDSWTFQFAQPRDVWNMNGRVDWAPADAHRLTLSGFYFERNATSNDARVQSVYGNPNGGTSGNTFSPNGLYGAGGAEISELPQAVINAKWTWMARPSLFIEAHGAWSYAAEKVFLNETALGTTMADLGSNDPLPRPDAPEMLPSIAIGQWWGSPETAVMFNGWTTDFASGTTTAGSSATWLTGPHTLKLGFEFQRGSHKRAKPARQDDVSAYQFSGYFSSNFQPWEGGYGASFAHGFADFLMGRFDYYAVNDGFENELHSHSLAGYVMDTWRVTPRLTVTGGLRYDFNSGISEKSNELTLYREGLQSTVFPNAPEGVAVPGDPGIPDTLSGSFHKLAPRLNVAWDLTGDGKTALRGSVGLYYGRDSLALWNPYFRQPPWVASSIWASGGLMRDPWLTSLYPSYESLPLPLEDYDPYSYVWPARVPLSLLDPQYTLPSSWQWNVAIEREVLPRITLEVGYQGNSSTTTPTTVPTNLAEWEEGANEINVQARRPNQFLSGSGLEFTNSGRLRYDQLLVIARARRAGLFGQVAYAYTHQRQNFTSRVDYQNNGVIFPYNPSLMNDWQDQHSVSGFVVWDLPLYNGERSGLAWVLLDDWQVTANGYWTFGNTTWVAWAGFDSNADGWGVADLVMVVGDVQYPMTPLDEGDLLYQWIDPGAFRFPDGTTTAGYSPNVVYDSNEGLGGLPGAWSLDASLMKTFLLGGELRLQLRFEVFNLFNHANLNLPISALSDPNFGKIRGKSHSPRQVQMGIRLTF